jgi:hypothetical protein
VPKLSYANIRMSLQITGFAILAVLLASCQSTPKISAIYESNEDFSQYKTFAFLPILNPKERPYTLLIDKYLRTAITRELRGRGLQEAPDAALLVGFYIRTKEKLTTVPTSFPINSHRYWGRHGYGVGYGTRIIQYTESTLTIDIINRTQKQLIWQGVAVGSLGEQQSATLVADIVAAVFNEYPIKPSVP